MKSRLLNRKWISPITSITFLIVGVTGVLLAFNIGTGGIKILHEWVGYTFMLAAVVHLLINWKPFTIYFRERSVILSALVGIILSLTVIYAIGDGDEHRRSHPLIQTFDVNANGVIDAEEISMATASLNKLDVNKNGVISAEEFMSGRGAPEAHRLNQNR